MIYTNPEVAWVGKTEEQVKAAGISYKVGRFPFSANGRARINHEAQGFVKVLSDAESYRVLGVHMIGPSVSEIIARSLPRDGVSRRQRGYRANLPCPSDPCGSVAAGRHGC